MTFLSRAATSEQPSTQILLLCGGGEKRKMLTRAAIIVGRRVVVVTRRRPILSVATTVGRQHPSGDASISTTLSLKVERKLTTLREEGSGNEERGKKHAGEGNSTGAGSLGAKGVSRRGPVVKSTNMENLENISSSDGNKAVTAVEGHSNDNPHVRGRGNTMRANRRSVERMSRYSKNDNSAQGERGTKPQARRTPAVVKRDAFEEADIKYVTELTSLMKVGNWIKIIDTYKQARAAGHEREAGFCSVLSCTYTKILLITCLVVIIGLYKY